MRALSYICATEKPATKGDQCYRKLDMNAQIVNVFPWNFE